MAIYYQNKTYQLKEGEFDPYISLSKHMSICEECGGKRIFTGIVNETYTEIFGRVKKRTEMIIQCENGHEPIYTRAKEEIIELR